MDAYTHLDLVRLKGWLKAATVQPPEALAREKSEQWIRDDPRKRVKLPPKESPKLKRRLALELGQHLQDIRRGKFFDVADAVESTTQWNRKIQLLQAFASDLEKDPSRIHRWKYSAPVTEDDVNDLLNREGP